MTEKLRGRDAYLSHLMGKIPRVSKLTESNAPLKNLSGAKKITQYLRRRKNSHIHLFLSEFYDNVYEKAKDAQIIKNGLFTFDKCHTKMHHF